MIMRFFWVNKCIENDFKCPKCQMPIGDNGQLRTTYPNYVIQTFDGGQVKCAFCNTLIGYFPDKALIGLDAVQHGMSDKILENVDYVTPIDQEEF